VSYAVSSADADPANPIRNIRLYAYPPYRDVRDFTAIGLTGLWSADNRFFSRVFLHSLGGFLSPLLLEDQREMLGLLSGRPTSFLIRE
jgi:hypothetical protein